MYYKMMGIIIVLVSTWMTTAFQESVIGLLGPLLMIVGVAIGAKGIRDSSK